MQESRKNAVAICSSCIRKLYPNIGKFTAKQISIGMFVKKCFGKVKKEHMWVKVLKKEKNKIIGILANEPFYTDEKIKRGDNVNVRYEEIEQVMCKGLNGNDT